MRLYSCQIRHEDRLIWAGHVEAPDAKGARMRFAATYTAHSTLEALARLAESSPELAENIVALPPVGDCVVVARVSKAKNAADWVPVEELGSPVND